MPRLGEMVDTMIDRDLRGARMRAALAAGLEQARDEQAVFDLACSIAVDLGGHAWAWVGKAEHDERRTVRPIAHAGDGAVEMMGVEVVWSTSAHGRGATGTAIRTRVPCVVDGLAAHPYPHSWHDLVVRNGLEAALSLPVVIGDELFGALTLCSREAEAFDADEIALLVGFLRGVTKALAEMRARAALQRAELAGEGGDAAGSPSSRARTAEALRRSERRFRRMLDGGWDVVTLQDPNGHCLYASGSSERVLGIPSDEMLHLDIGDHVHPEDRAGLVAAFRAVAETPDASRRFEIRFRRGEGWLWLQGVSVNLLHDPDVRAILTITRDVTSRMETELALAASEQQLRLIADHIRDVLWIVDPTTPRLIYVSAAYESIWGAPVPGYDSTPSAWIAAIFHDDLDELRRAFVSCVLGKQTVEMDCRILRPDGGVRHVRTTASPVLDDAGGVMRIVGVTREVPGGPALDAGSVAHIGAPAREARAEPPSGQTGARRRVR